MYVACIQRCICIITCINNKYCKQLVIIVAIVITNTITIRSSNIVVIMITPCACLYIYTSGNTSTL